MTRTAYARTPGIDTAGTLTFTLGLEVKPSLLLMRGGLQSQLTWVSSFLTTGLESSPPCVSHFLRTNIFKIMPYK